MSHLWAVVNKSGEIVNWKSESDGEEGMEIHRTRKLAEGARMSGETVQMVHMELMGSYRNRRRMQAIIDADNQGDD